MGSFIYLILLVVLGVMIFNNIKLAKRAKHTKKYINCSNGIFNNDEDTLERINDYIANDDSVEFQNKARVLKVYEELRHNIDPSNTISQIELYDTIYTKDKFDMQKFEFNSDTYFWLLLDITKIYMSDFKDAVNDLKAVVDKHHEAIKTDIAVELFYCIDNILGDNENKDTTFFRKLIDGEYAQYSYDKRLIGFYKKVAVAMLAYMNENLSDEDLEDLKIFSTMKAGKLLMKDLGIYETYKKDDGLDEKPLPEGNDIEETLNNENEEVSEEVKKVSEEVLNKEETETNEENIEEKDEE